MTHSFNWRLANVTLIKTFVTSFFTPLAGAQIVFNSEYLLSIYVGVISSGVMCGIVGGQILERYMKYLRESNDNGAF